MTEAERTKNPLMFKGICQIISYSLKKSLWSQGFFMKLMILWILVFLLSLNSSPPQDVISEVSNPLTLHLFLRGMVNAEVSSPPPLPPEEKKNLKANLSSLSEEEITLHIRKGMSLDEVARLLKAKGLLRSVFYFKMWASLKGASKKIKSGEYVFKKNVSSREILATLVEGRVKLYPITFPEGYNIYEMALALEKKGFLKKKDFLSLSQNPEFVYELLKEKRPSLEGYLFPDTYHIPRPLDPKKLLYKMTKKFFTVYGEVSRKTVKTPGTRGIKLTRHEALILASIVEKETGATQEREKIASVFYNRLKKGMRLESDPTILYGMMWERGGLIPLNIRKKDILRKTPYNTYRISGFPAGPIGNPGEGALRAVFEPENSPFFYFVSRNDGTHVFSKTYQEHERAVDRFQRRTK